MLRLSNPASSHYLEDLRSLLHSSKTQAPHGENTSIYEIMDTKHVAQSLAQKKSSTAKNCSGHRTIDDHTESM